MEFSMRSMASGHGPLAANASAEIATAAAHSSSIRLLNTGVITETAAQSDFADPMAWALPNPVSVGGEASDVWSGFSATCWYYGRELATLTGRPVGLIMAAQGATAIESWMSAPSLYGPNGTTAGSSCPDTLDGERGSDTRAPNLPPGAIPPNSASPPTSNFNGQIAPLVQMAIKGVIWYQVSCCNQRQSIACLLLAARYHPVCLLLVVASKQGSMICCPLAK
jgi:sialate O-acetylesterase